MRGLASPHPILGASRCVPVLVGFVVDNIGSARLVLLVTKQLALFLLFRRQAQDARHHGRYGREGQRMLLLIFKPLVYDSHLSGVCLAEVSRSMDFSGR